MLAAFHANVEDPISSSLIEGMRRTDEQSAEYIILKKEWDALRESLSDTDRQRIRTLGEEVQALSIALHELYNQAIVLAQASATQGREELDALKKAAGGVQRYRTDNGESSLMDTQA
jgi:hypothetical protein